MLGTWVALQICIPLHQVARAVCPDVTLRSPAAHPPLTLRSPSAHPPPADPFSFPVTPPSEVAPPPDPAPLFGSWASLKSSPDRKVGGS